MQVCILFLKAMARKTETKSSHMHNDVPKNHTNIWCDLKIRVPCQGRCVKPIHILYLKALGIRD